MAARKPVPTSPPAPADTRGTGGELHQSYGGSHPPLTTNQGIPVSDNQNSLRSSTRGPTLLEDFVLREKITHFATSASPSASCMRAARPPMAFSN